MRTCSVGSGGVVRDGAGPFRRAKKIISFRGPNARGLAQDIEKMERLLPGIDGVAIYPSTYGEGIPTDDVGPYGSTRF